MLWNDEQHFVHIFIHNSLILVVLYIFLYRHTQPTKHSTRFPATTTFTKLQCSFHFNSHRNMKKGKADHQIITILEATCFEDCSAKQQQITVAPTCIKLKMILVLCTMLFGTFCVLKNTDYRFISVHRNLLGNSEDHMELIHYYERDAENRVKDHQVKFTSGPLTHLTYQEVSDELVKKYEKANKNNEWILAFVSDLLLAEGKILKSCNTQTDEKDKCITPQCETKHYQTMHCVLASAKTVNAVYYWDEDEGLKEEKKNHIQLLLPGESDFVDLTHELSEDEIITRMLSNSPKINRDTCKFQQFPMTEPCLSTAIAKSAIGTAVSIASGGLLGFQSAGFDKLLKSTTHKLLEDKVKGKLKEKAIGLAADTATSSLDQTAAEYTSKIKYCDFKHYQFMVCEIN